MQIPLFEVKNKLSTFVNLAEQGERIEITRHGKTAAVLVNVDTISSNEEITTTPFYIAYMDFRKKLEREKLTEAEWKESFDIERRKSVPRHPEDFE